ncbi:acetyl-CoA C-acetyltransferase [Pseudomonas sp. GD03860]|uniref:acetyl-CoA C-acetyltransferase n=1 Tax=Pseudomonas TaxID=286 RepID=UPI0023643FEC|nr:MULTISPECIES: acetyl-CoA C-acetyltransferase [Pseudomonas]MDD2058370.1 acetyl-CoA C-acetyltransferase [Pseudomonas putida]MDH0636300.1 acetyl-CoA C-acetyltransferase [Pseudomonas sp. GD03860]
MNDALIFDHVRSPRGKGRAGGALHEVTATALASQALTALRNRNQLDTALVDDVMLGCVMAAGEQGGNIARIAALNADYAQTVPGFQLNRYCASGLEALNLAASTIRAGQAQAIVAGGVEAMSRVPIGSDGGAVYTDPQVIHKTWYIPQGIGADLIAEQDGYSREEVDAFALRSQQRAAAAQQDGFFDRSLFTVRDILGEPLLERDEAIRCDATAQDLAKLKPAFEGIGAQAGFDGVMLQRYPEVESIRHVHTAGNSSAIVDGAAAILVGNAQFGQASGLRARARVRSYTSIGSEPAIMLTGPAACTEKLLQRAGLTVQDIDLFEVNEAFASVVMRYMRHFNLDPAKVNVNGGSIAMGHPLGATGAMLVGTVLDELERRDLNTAVITLCAAAGMATATLIERI